MKTILAGNADSVDGFLVEGTKNEFCEGALLSLFYFVGRLISRTYLWTRWELGWVTGRKDVLPWFDGGRPFPTLVVGIFDVDESTIAEIGNAALDWAHFGIHDHGGRGNEVTEKDQDQGGGTNDEGVHHCVTGERQGSV